MKRRSRMGFPEGTVVRVEQAGEETWKLLHEVRYDDPDRTFLAKVDSETDFASVPRVFVWLLPRYGVYTKAAIIHDYLWQRGVVNGEITLRNADALFRRAMSELGVPFLTRWVMWGAVRWGAVLKKGPPADWWKDFPLVALFTVLMLPVIVVPALAILLALGIFWVIEFAVWTVLKIWARSSRSFAPERRPRAPVNKPEISWKL
jgi:hypothetical protein